MSMYIVAIILGTVAGLVITHHVDTIEQIQNGVKELKEELTSMKSKE